MKSTSVMVTVVVACLVAGAMLTGCGGGSGGPSWQVTNNSGVWQIAYGSDADLPQYAALDLSSGYLRMVPTRNSAWGTQAIVMPALWTGGTYYQGAPITPTIGFAGQDLLVDFTGTIGGLSVIGEIRFSPPAQDELQARVFVATTGNITLDGNRPGEAFKPVMLTSMHATATLWDAESAFVGTQTYPLPGGALECFLIEPPVQGQVFGLKGGSCAHVTNAPTIEVALDQPRLITGWQSTSVSIGPGGGAPQPITDRDNIGFWAAADTVLPSWQYTLTAKR